MQMNTILNFEFFILYPCWNRLLTDETSDPPNDSTTQEGNAKSYLLLSKKK